MAFPSDLRWFSASEFKYPDNMDVSFLRWLDRVREESGVPMVITDDYRPPGDVPEGGSTTSLHFRGRAVDVHARDWTVIQRWDLAQAIFTLADEAPGKVEFELVLGAQDHWHIGANDQALNHDLLERMS